MTKTIDLHAILFYFGIAALVGVAFLAGCRTSVATSKATSFLIDERGRINGLILANEDQLHFNPETGNAVKLIVKIGDDVSFAGTFGATTVYGRAVEIDQVTANGQSVTALKPLPPPRPENKNADEPLSGKTPEMPAVADPAPEAMSVTSDTKKVLVNMTGDVDGLLLANGTIVRFPPRIADALKQAGVNFLTSVTVQGSGVRNESLTFITPTTLTIGNQTFTY